MNRSCARPTCAEPATATLSYVYAESTVWLDHLHHDGHPANHDLCNRHSARLQVPKGWVLRDRRSEVMARPA